jgi:geranylgeranyl pyrophosphate synthase
MEVTELGDLLGLTGLGQRVVAVEATMADLLGTTDASLAEPCLRILRARGKRLRPILVMAAAECGPEPPDPRTVLAAASAVELLHIGSLVHDDIMDHAEDRRGVPTISFREGPHTAILCGDVLFALSGQAAALVSPAAAVELAQTIVAICNGQIREQLDNFNPARSEQAIFESMEAKTAALLRTSCRLGGHCSGLDEDAIDALGAYGHAFGMAFQLVDDVQDFLSTRNVTGKPVLNDVRCGVYTLPVALALRDDYGRELFDVLELNDDLAASSAPVHEAQLTDAQVETAVGILRSGDYFRRVLDLAMDYAGRAAGHVSSLPDSPAARGLARLPGMYVEKQLRALEDMHVLGHRASARGAS